MISGSYGTSPHGSPGPLGRSLWGTGCAAPGRQGRSALHVQGCAGEGASRGLGLGAGLGSWAGLRLGWLAFGLISLILAWIWISAWIWIWLSFTWIWVGFGLIRLDFGWIRLDLVWLGFDIAPIALIAL